MMSPLLAVLLVYLVLFLTYKKLWPSFRRERGKPVVYRELCNGCGNCVIVCPPNALTSKAIMGGKGNGAQVIDIENGVAVEADLEKCERWKEKDPCKLCIEACPLNAIDFTY